MSCRYDVVQCVPTRRGHQILYKSYTYVFKNDGVPDWVTIYFTSIASKEMKCNLCDAEIGVNANSPALVDHMRESHKDIYDLHKDNPEATVGFRVEFLHMNVLKSDEVVQKLPSVYVEEVCEVPGVVEAIDITQETEETDVINMQYVMLDSKRKQRRDSGHIPRKRSWIWKYFDRLSNIVYRCNVCNVVLSTKGSNTNNLNRHMRSKHPDTFKTEKFGEAMLKETTMLETSNDPNTPFAVTTEEIYACNNSESQSQKLRRSWIWSYFDYVSTKQAQCKLCRRHINHGGNATGNMNRHLKMIHNKTATERDVSWVWKVFEKESEFYTCKICQHQLSKDNPDSDMMAIANHLKREHGVVSGDQIVRV